MDCYSGDLTIVLTLWNRFDFTPRWVSHLMKQGCKFRVIVADGSASNDAQEFFENTLNFQGLNLNYIRYPVDRGFEDFYKKLKSVISVVRSPYILLADNDDFYIVDYLYRMISFLDSHPDYSCARTTTLNFWISRYNEPFSKAPYGNLISGYLGNGRSIDYDPAAKRVTTFISEIDSQDHLMMYYGVTRTDIMKRAVEKYFIAELDVFLAEVLTLAEIVRSGKVFVAKQAGYYRQIGTSTALASYRSRNESLLKKLLIRDPTQQFLIMQDFARTVSQKDDLACQQVLQSLLDMIVRHSHLQYLEITAQRRFFSFFRSLISQSPSIYYAVRKITHPFSSVPVLLKDFLRSVS